MGNANSARPADLPPSQGGKYGGFGSTPAEDFPPSTSASSSAHPSYHLSSQAVPTLDELQRNPLGALTKGWGLFSSALAVAGKEINEAVVKPGMEAVNNDDNLKKYLGTAQYAGGWLGQRAGEGWQGLSEVAKAKGGVDLNEQLGKLGLGGGGASSSRGGYGQLERAEDGILSPHGGGAREEDFFDEWDEQPTKAAAPVTKGKKDDGWGEDDGWKDF
ncbi:hypothetical protein P7C73_g5130, partial [Tremellales sp. Uapishka_1]